MKKLVLESTAPFQGLPEIIAFKEGLFEKEGLLVEWADRDVGNKSELATDVLAPAGLDPFVSHGKLFEQGRADMYNACEAGNYCRIQDTQNGSRQLGRRAIITYSAIVVGPSSEIFTPQQLANVAVGVPFYFGSHYLALQLLDGFLPREMIKLCSAPNKSHKRFQALMDGKVEAVTLMEPYVSLAEKMGCRIVCAAFLHGSEVGSDRVDAETYSAFNRAVREAVRRINADKAAYLHHFIDYHVARGELEPNALRVADLRASRLVVTDPAPIPQDELERTSAWLKSWNMLEHVDAPAMLINDDIQRFAHEAAA